MQDKEDQQGTRKIRMQQLAERKPVNGHQEKRKRESQQLKGGPVDDHKQANCNLKFFKGNTAGHLIIIYLPNGMDFVFRCMALNSFL